MEVCGCCMGARGRVCDMGVAWVEGCVFGGGVWVLHGWRGVWVEVCGCCMGGGVHVCVRGLHGWRCVVGGCTK